MAMGIYACFGGNFIIVSYGMVGVVYCCWRRRLGVDEVSPLHLRKVGRSEVMQKLNWDSDLFMIATMIKVTGHQKLIWPRK